MPRFYPNHPLGHDVRHHHQLNQIIEREKNVLRTFCLKMETDKSLQTNHDIIKPETKTTHFVKKLKKNSSWHSKRNFFNFSHEKELGTRQLM
jgi:hypothetical protein